MTLLTKLFNFVLLCVSKYNIDESHGLSHAMNILTCADKIYTQELVKEPLIKDQKKIIYISAILHDMCDKKYMEQNKGIQDINDFIGTLKDNKDVSLVTDTEKEIINKIITTMSYSYVKKNGFPDLGEYQTAYNIVREADLLCAYDFDRCMIYQMYNKNYPLDDAFNDAVKLFDVRMFKHYDDGLLLTDYAKNNYKMMEHTSKLQINQWKKLLTKKL
jgi:hypothetical protein